MNIWTVLKDVMKINYVLENIFIVQQKIKKISEDGKISDVHVSIEDYMVCEKIWDKFKMKNITMIIV